MDYGTFPEKPLRLTARLPLAHRYNVVMEPIKHRRLLLLWDGFNVLLWLIVLGAIAALLLPATL